MSTDMSPENESLLNQFLATGQYKNRDEALTRALDLLRDEENSRQQQQLSEDDWRNKFQQHLAFVPSTKAVEVDCSRESIYQGRG